LIEATQGGHESEYAEWVIERSEWMLMGGIERADGRYDVEAFEDGKRGEGRGVCEQESADGKK
jgi:hypothetical protein